MKDWGNKNSDTYLFKAILPNKIVLYKVEYDLNGGTSAAIPHQIKLKDNTLVLTDVVPVRDGYDFIGWDTNPTKPYSSVSVLPTYSTTGNYTNNSNSIYLTKNVMTKK